jgi:uncharacterized protein YjiS (DUF1127 family)
MTDISESKEKTSPRKWHAGLTQRMMRKIRERIEVWRVTRRLLAADDAMLKDIGISRGDIEWMVRHGRRPGPRHHPE